MASTHDEEQSAHNSNSRGGALPAEPPVPIAKSTYPGFPYYTCKNGVNWYKVGGGTVKKQEGLEAWEKYRNQRNEEGSDHAIPDELPTLEKEKRNQEGEAEGEVEEEARASKKARSEGQNEEENDSGHQETNNKRKDHHKPLPLPEDEVMTGTRQVIQATGTKVSVSQTGDQEDGEGRESEKRNERHGDSNSANKGNGNGHPDRQGSGDGQPDYQENGDGRWDPVKEPEGWDPVEEPEGYDPYAPVNFVDYTAYHYRKETDEHWCILPDPGDGKKNKWARAEGRAWGVRKTVVASFHPLPPESKRPRRYYGFKSQKVGNFQTQLPYLLMASAQQLRFYGKEKGTMPSIVGAAWDWDEDKENRELQSNPIRRVVFGPDLTTFGEFDKGPNTHKDRQFTKRAWASASTCRAAEIKIDAEYATALDRAGQEPPPKMKKPEVRSDLQAQGSMIQDSLVPRYLMGRQETNPEVYRAGMVPDLTRMLPEAHRAGMLPAPNGPRVDVDSVRSPSRGLSVPWGQYPRDIVELESARSQSRELSVPRGQTPLESIETEPVQVQSREPSVPRGQTPLGSTEGRSARSQSEGSSVFSQASTVGSVRSDSVGPVGQLLQKSLDEGSFVPLLQEVIRKTPTHRQVHFED